ncbi:MAG: hypothetical protein HS101_06405 [Planctomycetia bacterium]|jgi:acyl carrier protein|nr:hypothetical protein [Planctomycetia bacterium]MCC7314149.1 hypothetical protein [Planctomycetota bacterium]OQZ05887.1 MAG: hypothetical protein B6D36_07845 [Planctomycetes bacterium UTPLA1]
MAVAAEKTRDQLRRYLFETLIPTPPNAWPADDADLYANGLDSLRLMQLLTFIEQDIGINLPDDEVTPERVGSVASIVEWITNRNG